MANETTAFIETYTIAGWLLFAGELFSVFYTPLLCIFGAVGNCLSVCVFCMTAAHRNLSSSYYLSALAISDTVFLVNHFASWLINFKIDILSLTCPLMYYMTQVTSFLSVWLTVAFTVERFFAVCYPLTRPTVCTVARAKKVIAGLTIFGLTSFSYVWVVNDIIVIQRGEMIEDDSLGFNRTDFSDQRNSSNSSDSISFCGPIQGYGGVVEIFNHIDSIVTLILPFCLIMFFNMRIALCVWKLKDQREHIVAVSKFSNKGVQNCNKHKMKNKFNHNNLNVRGAKSNLLVRNDSNQRCKTNLLGRKTNNGHSGQVCVKINFGMNGGSVNSSEYQLSSSLSATSLNNGTNYSTVSVQQRRGFGGRSGLSSPSHSAAEVRVTKTLLLVSTVFLVLNLPSHVVRAVSFILMDKEPTVTRELKAAETWANILFYTNFSVNFLLYCVSGKNFRKSLRNICCKTRRANDNNSRRGTSFRPSRVRSDRGVSNNGNGITGGSHHQEDTVSLDTQPNEEEKQGGYPPASVTELEMETTFT